MKKNTLHLILKKEWYELIDCGDKTEEYRELSPHWIVRLLAWFFLINPHTIVDERITMEEARTIAEEGVDAYPGVLIPKDYGTVCFSCGYTKRRMTFECKGISLGRGRPEWGAPNHETFIIKLGKRL